MCSIVQIRPVSQYSCNDLFAIKAISGLYIFITNQVIILLIKQAKKAVVLLKTTQIYYQFINGEGKSDNIPVYEFFLPK